MTPDLQACLLCDDVRQERNGKFILIGLFDNINMHQFPLAFPRMCLVSRWCGGEGEFKQTSRLLKPDQKTIVVQGQPIPVRLPNVETVVTNVEVFMNIVFTEAGMHWIEVLLNGDLKIRYPLRVMLITPPGGKSANLPPA
jgi:hypothetical protein